jgi:hypothetical protein
VHKHDHPANPRIQEPARGRLALDRLIETAASTRRDAYVLGPAGQIAPTANLSVFGVIRPMAER